MIDVRLKNGHFFVDQILQNVQFEGAFGGKLIRSMFEGKEPNHYVQKANLQNLNNAGNVKYFFSLLNERRE